MDFDIALNIYLTFFHKFNQHDSRRLEWIYGTCYYGIPFVPALVYLFINIPAKGKIADPQW
jgi:hypothetical protein